MAILFKLLIIKKLKDSYAFTSGLYFEDRMFRTQLLIQSLEKTKYYRFGGDCYMYGMLSFRT